MTLCAVFLFFLSFAAPSRAADLETFPDLNVNDPLSLQEASRVLEEELKLAARPQTYVLIDLVSRSIQLKSRGIALHRLPIECWSLTSGEAMTGIFRLLARPAVVRRKIDPGTTVEQEPISLADMPIQYELSFAPSLTLEVFPPAGDHPFLWSWSSGRTWWRQLKSWGSTLLTHQSTPPPPSLQLTLSTEHVQSLAWSLVDGMPVIIRRPHTE